MNEPASQKPADFRWQAFFQRSRAPLFVLNRQRRLLFVNRAWEELTGLSLGQVRGLACTRRTPAAPSATDAVTRAHCPPPEVLRGQSARVRHVVSTAMGGRHCWDVDFLPIHDDDGTLGILGKITPLARAETAAATVLPDALVALRATLAHRHVLEALGATAPAQRRLVEQVRLAGQSRAAVLLLGERGTGKQWLARTIHYQGATREQAFAALDCRRLPPAALTEALFGESRLTRRPGIGTLYLKEPTSLPRDLQARLCELLAEPVPTMPRLLAGACSDLAEEVRAGRLLEELRCALGTLAIEVQPLRQRQAELPWLTEKLLERAAGEGSQHLHTLTPAAWECLRAYPWPGNVRELYAVLRSACAHAAGDCVDAPDLPGYVRLAVRLEQTSGARTDRPLPLDQMLEQVERRLIQLALERARGNKSRAAEILAVWRPRLLRRMEALGIRED